MNKLTRNKRIQVLGALVEGNSIRSTVRMTGAAKNTVVKLLRDAGHACEQYHNKVILLPGLLFHHNSIISQKTLLW